MSAEFSEQSLASPSHAFFAVGDHQNLRRKLLAEPLDAAAIRYALNYQLLFSERIFFIAEDMLVNERLMGLLLNEYRPILVDGLFVPLLRRPFETIADCARYLTAADYYNQTGDEIWRQYLRQIKATKHAVGFFDPDEAYAHFTAVARAYLTDARVLRDLGVTVPASSIDAGVTQAARAAKRTEWRRSAIFAYADELAQGRLIGDARVLRQLGSVIYMAHFGGLFRQVSVFPRWYVPYIDVLAALPVGLTGELPQMAENVTIELEALLPHARKQDLAEMDVSDIYELRESAAFKAYVDALLEPGAPTLRRTNRVLATIGDYLETIDRYVAERQSGMHDATQRGRAALGIVRGSGATAGVLSLVDIVAGVAGPAADLTLAGLALCFLVLERELSGGLDAAAAERRQFWQTYCGVDGTFAAQISPLRGRFDLA